MKSVGRAYSMRGMPDKIRDRLRVLAAVEKTTMEWQVVAALEAGLAERYFKILEARKRKVMGKR